MPVTYRDAGRRVRRAGWVETGGVRLPVPGETTVGALAGLLGEPFAEMLLKTGAAESRGVHTAYQLLFTLLPEDRR